MKNTKKIVAFAGGAAVVAIALLGTFSIALADNGTVAAGGTCNVNSDCSGTLECNPQASYTCMTPGNGTVGASCLNVLDTACTAGSVCSSGTATCVATVLTTSPATQPATTTQPAAATAPAASTTSTATSGSNCAANSSSTTICNPLPDATIGAFVVRMVGYILSIIAAVAVVMIVIAGFRMVLASGNDDALKKARSQITNAVIGLAITVLAYAAIAILTNVLKGL